MSTPDPLPDPPLPPAAQRERARAQARRARRRRALSTEKIVDAALKVLDEEGLDAMTMRRVARELNTGAASLYAHVADKEELIALVMERVISEVELPPAGSGDWAEHAKEFARRARATLAAHNDVARAAFARIPLGPNALRTMDAVLGALRAAELPDDVVGLAADLLPLYVNAVAYEESLYSQQDVSPEEFEAYARRMRDYFAALPPDQFPNLTALAGPLTAAPTGEARFEFGLEVLVRGIEAVARERRRAR
jgi:TetR/AcrR family transcriptional regulator, tetracycline repressor protein